ncbi:MAG: deoxyribonuclease IV [Candidatus Eremiobacteraeota bacterium]|nr:deoxyribonuclease IV [Candidatus Eremiobacteraeota bacterium]
MPGPLLGAHVSTAGGHHKCFERAAELGCEAIQIFTRAPSRWQGPALSAKGVEQFRQARSQHGSPPVIAHDIYLANLAAADDTIRQRSLDSMLNELGRCEALGLDGLVCHMGSHPDEDQGLQRYGQAIAEILEKTNRCPILLETTAGQGTCLGHRLEHLARVIEANRAHPRLGVCLDTCHVFAAGYDLRDEQDYEAFWDEFERMVGLDRLKALHLNDSKKPLASRVDRHAHIGQGEIGETAFRLLVNDPRLEGLPMLLETPEMESMHRVNLDLLKSFRKN